MTGEARTAPSSVLLRFIGEAGLYGHETQVGEPHYAICACDDPAAVWHHELITNADGSQWSTTDRDEADRERQYTSGHLVDFLPYSGRTPAITTPEAS